MAFGHDEEVGGKQGAGFIARKLEESLNKENEKLSFILDEGMFVMDGVFPGVSDPVAYVGNDYKNKHKTLKIVLCQISLRRWLCYCFRGGKVLDNVVYTSENC